MRLVCDLQLYYYYYFITVSKPQRQPTPLACPHRVLLRVALGQTDCHTGPKRPVIAPIPQAEANSRAHALRAALTLIPFYNSLHYFITTTLLLVLVLVVPPYCHFISPVLIPWLQPHRGRLLSRRLILG